MLILVFKKIRNLRIGLEMKFEKSVAKKDCTSKIVRISKKTTKQTNKQKNKDITLVFLIRNLGQASAFKVANI